MMMGSAAHLPSPHHSSEAPIQPPIEISSPSLVVRMFVDLMYHAPILSSLTAQAPAPTRSEHPDTSTPPSPSSAPPAPAVHFVDMFRAANAPYRGPGNEIACLSALLELLDRFDCGIGMRERALAHFAGTFSSDPWSVFCIAGKYGDVGLGKTAIERFAKTQGGQRAKLIPGTMEPGDAGRLPIEWLMGYIRAHGEMTAKRGLVVSAFSPSSPAYYLTSFYLTHIFL